MVVMDVVLDLSDYAGFSNGFSTQHAAAAERHRPPPGPRYLATPAPHGGKLINYYKGGLRRGGLTPVLAPRMPVNTEDAGKSRRQRRQLLPRGTSKNKSCLKRNNQIQ